VNPRNTTKEEVMNIARIKRVLTGPVAALWLVGAVIYSTSATATTYGTLSFSGKVTDPSPRASKALNNEAIDDADGEDFDEHFIYTKEPVAGSNLVLSSVVLGYYSTYALPDAVLLTLAVH
jgi:hypothetical protein